MIYFDNVSFSYSRKGEPALEGVTARIGAGIHLLMGANGAGKTTLLNIAGGADFPTAGACLAGGVDTRLRLPSQLSGVTMMSTGMRLPAATLRQMTKIHAVFYPRFSAEMLEKNLAAFGITLDQPLGSMSLGTANKAAVAYVLSLQTDIVLLDEPANGLDIESKIQLQRMIAQSVRPDACCIVSTHTVADMQHLYDGVIVLDKGHLALCATIDSLLERVTFVTSLRPPVDSLYSHNVAGRIVSIVPAGSDSAESCAETEIDYALLYLALHNPDSQPLKQILNQ